MKRIGTSLKQLECAGGLAMSESVLNRCLYFKKKKPVVWVVALVATPGVTPILLGTA